VDKRLNHFFDRKKKSFTVKLFFEGKCTA